MLCWIGSVCVGYAFFGGGIFQRELAVFQFVATGAISGLAVAMAARGRPKWPLAFFIIGFLATIVLTGSLTPARLLRDVVLVVAVILAVQAGLRWNTVFPHLVIGKFVLWAAGFAVIQAVAVGLMAAILRAPAAAETMLGAARIGVLLGSGVGLGYEMAEIVSRRLGGRAAAV